MIEDLLSAGENSPLGEERLAKKIRWAGVIESARGHGETSCID
jgi:hypothetical protein